MFGGTKHANDCETLEQCLINKVYRGRTSEDPSSVNSARSEEN